jgi:hypothetical protein
MIVDVVLGCDATWSHRQIPVFQGSVLSLHSVTIENYIFTAVRTSDLT